MSTNKPTTPTTGSAKSKSVVYPTRQTPHCAAKSASLVKNATAVSSVSQDISEGKTSTSSTNNNITWNLSKSFSYEDDEEAYVVAESYNTTSDEGTDESKPKATTTASVRKQGSSITHLVVTYQSCEEFCIASGKSKTVLLAMAQGVNMVDNDINKEPYKCAKNRHSLVPQAKDLCDKILRRSQAYGSLEPKHHVLRHGRIKRRSNG
jgi:hypothetical protein